MKVVFFVSLLLCSAFGYRFLCVSIFPCANPILGDFKPLSKIVSELSNRGHEIEYVMYDEYISWIPNDKSNIHKLGVGKCPFTKTEEENFFNDFSLKNYDETISPIVNYFQSYSNQLTKEIWNKKNKIEQDLGGKIDAIIAGDVFSLGTTLAERFDSKLIKIHPGNLFEGGLNTIGGLNIHFNQVDSSFIETKHLPIPLFLKRILNHFFLILLIIKLQKVQLNMKIHFELK